MAKLNNTMRKLQRAIITKRLIIKIGTSQFYSEEQKRIITVYILSTPYMTQNRHGDWKIRDLEILRSASQLEITMCLKYIWEAVREWR